MTIKKALEKLYKKMIGTDSQGKGGISGVINELAENYTGGGGGETNDFIFDVKIDSNGGADYTDELRAAAAQIEENLEAGKKIVCRLDINDYGYTNTTPYYLVLSNRILEGSDYEYYFSSYEYYGHVSYGEENFVKLYMQVSDTGILAENIYIWVSSLQTIIDESTSALSEQVGNLEEDAPILVKVTIDEYDNTSVTKGEGADILQAISNHLEVIRAVVADERSTATANEYLPYQLTAVTAQRGITVDDATVARVWFMGNVLYDNSGTMTPKAVTMSIDIDESSYEFGNIDITVET